MKTKMAFGLLNFLFQTFRLICLGQYCLFVQICSDFLTTCFQTYMEMSRISSGTFSVRTMGFPIELWPPSPEMLIILEKTKVLLNITIFNMLLPEFHIIVCGLDSIIARRWINGMLVNTFSF